MGLPAAVGPVAVPEVPPLPGAPPPALRPVPGAVPPEACPPLAVPPATPPEACPPLAVPPASPPAACPPLAVPPAIPPLPPGPGAVPPEARPPVAVPPPVPGTALPPSAPAPPEPVTAAPPLPVVVPLPPPHAASASATTNIRPLRESMPGIMTDSFRWQYDVRRDLNGRSPLIGIGSSEDRRHLNGEGRLFFRDRARDRILASPRSATSHRRRTTTKT